ncbi:MAG: hypothetical protein NT141_03615, partial [candidate division WWE3 bacterium]|nr:hypothetical protein [candidate division WWE3 bacterium]
TYSISIKNNMFYFLLTKKIDLQTVNKNLSNLSNLNQDLDFMRRLNIEPVMYNDDKNNLPPWRNG